MSEITKADIYDGAEFYRDGKEYTLKIGVDEKFIVVSFDNGDEGTIIFRDLLFDDSLKEKISNYFNENSYTKTAPAINLNDLQRKLADWQMHNFSQHKDSFKQMCALGVSEEAGELAHHVLKDWQNIREGQDPEKIRALIADDIGDIVIYAINLCTAYGINFNDAIADTVTEVLKRDWVKYPKNGVGE